MIIKYVNAKGQAIDLLKKPYRVIDTDVFDSKWDSSTNGYDKKVDIDVFDDQKNFLANMNRLYDVFAYDSEKGLLGKLYVNDTYIPCNVTATKKTGWKGNIYSVVSYTFHAPALSWIEEIKKDFMMRIVDEDYGRSYPYDYPFDYAPPKVGATVWNIDHIKDSEFAMIINGAVDNPEIKINDYRYRVFTTIQTGEYIIIDSQTKTIIKRLIDGTEINIFDDRDVEQSVFKKIAAGMNTIEWSGAFSFSIHVYKERREPRWM